jgi:hypothetical protein
MFKISGNQISEFKVLSKHTPVPIPRPRPKGYVPKGEVVYPKPSVYNMYTFDTSNFSREKLPYAAPKFNPVVAITGFILSCFAVIFPSTALIFLALIVSVSGILHILIQFSGKKLRATTLYNLAVIMFNGGNYEKAHKYLLRAAIKDSENEFVEYGIAKIKYYIK